MKASTHQALSKRPANRLVPDCGWQMPPWGNESAGTSDLELKVRQVTSVFPILWHAHPQVFPLPEGKRHISQRSTWLYRHPEHSHVPHRACSVCRAQSLAEGTQYRAKGEISVAWRGDFMFHRGKMHTELDRMCWVLTIAQNQTNHLGCIEGDVDRKQVVVL